MSKWNFAMMAGLAIALVAIGFASGRTADHEGTLFAGNTDDRLGALEQQQRAQYEELNNKIDRIANAVAPSRSGTAPQAGTRQGLLTRNPALLAQKAAETQAALEAQFQRQPVASGWAIESTRAIEQAITPASLKEIGAKAPVATDIDCRSSMCRIDMAYAGTDSGDAADAAVVLNMSIADRMPYSQVVQRANADGTFDYIVYASRERPAASKR